MVVTIPPRMADFVSDKVSSGENPTAADVVEAALRLLREKDEAGARLGELREAVAVGLAQADRGEVGPYSAAEALRRARERLAGRRKHDAARRLHHPGAG